MDVGEIVRRVHWRAWDPDAPAPEVSIGEVVAALPVLIESGSAGVVWPRLRDVIGSDHPAGMALEAAAASQAAHNARAERDLARVVGRLREVGVEPVLIKGLAVARLYPAGLVRPAGDLDLVVRDEDYSAAIGALGDARLSVHRDPASARLLGREIARRDRLGDDEHRPYVDLHAFSRWGEAVDASFFEEAEATRIGERDAPLLVRVPRAEDHLRALCLHFLRHAAVRPVRLCDIALLVERFTGGDDEHRPYAGIDWARVVRGTRREREQIALTLRLATGLLGAGAVPSPGAATGGARLPRWLGPAVLRQWATNPTAPGPALEEILANPRGIGATFRRRWPDPITATLRTGARFDDGPRLPVEVAAYAGQLGHYARVTLGRQVRDRRERANRAI